MKIEIDSRLNRVYSNVVKYKSISLKPVGYEAGKRIESGRFPEQYEMKTNDNSGPVFISE